MNTLEDFPGCGGCAHASNCTTPWPSACTTPCSAPQQARKLVNNATRELDGECSCVSVRREHRSFRSARLNDNSIPVEESTTYVIPRRFTANTSAKCPYVNDLLENEVEDNEHIKITDDGLEIGDDCLDEKIGPDYAVAPVFSRIEFLARRAPGSAPDAHRMTVLCNDSQVLAKDVVLSADYRFFNLRCMAAEICSIGILVFSCAGSEGKGGIQLDPEFGLRIDGSDQLHNLRLETPRAGTTLPKPLVADLNRGSHDLELSPGRYVAELSVEFVASGLSGREVVDVYINSFSSPCEIGAKVPMRSESPQLFRYVLCPINVAISSVLIQVRDSSSKSALNMSSTLPKGASGSGRGSDASSLMVIIDPTVGVRIGMQDCLASATLVQPCTSPVGWTPTPFNESPKGKVLLRTGQWRLPGLYRLLPYQCKKKPYKSKRLEDGAPAEPSEFPDALKKTNNIEELCLNFSGDEVGEAVHAV